MKAEVRLTFSAWRDSIYIRTFLGREDEGGTTEVVIQVDDRVDVVESELCVDLARQFEFWTDLEDATIDNE